jgi:hypothetical protein
MRLGLTESSLLVIYLLKKSNKLTEKEKNILNKNENNLIDWLYSTSGFYDKTIKGKYFDIDCEKAKNSVVYKSYFNILSNIIKNSDFHVELNLHKIFDTIESRENELKQFLREEYNFFKHKNHVSLMNFISNKNVLIINSIASLMKQQFESGNIHKINPDFPNDVKSIQFINTESTIENNGPDNNIFTTNYNLCCKIKMLEFDCAIISVGAYSFLLADFIKNISKKEVYVIGGILPVYFGIKTKRTSGFVDKINEYFINVPEELKPKNYMKVEKGCYW